MVESIDNVTDITVVKRYVINKLISVNLVSVS